MFSRIKPCIYLLITNLYDITKQRWVGPKTRVGTKPVIPDAKEAANMQKQIHPFPLFKCYSDQHHIQQDIVHLCVSTIK